MRHVGGTDTARSWARLGIAFGARPAPHEPDLERLLLASARELPRNGRLLPTIATWLAEYGNAVARHRLARLAAVELEPEDGAALGLLLDAAAASGGPADLAGLVGHRPVVPARPLSEEFRRTPALTAIAEGTASALSRRWGLWTPEITLKPDALRPASWLLAHNPSYRDRLLRKGDLRCSIVEALRHDAPDGRTRSEAELARLAGATRAAVRKALADLVREGDVAILPRAANGRDHAVVLRRAA